MQRDMACGSSGLARVQEREKKLIKELEQETKEKQDLAAKVANQKSQLHAMNDALSRETAEIKKLSEDADCSKKSAETEVLHREIEALKAKEAWLVADKRHLQAELEALGGKAGEPTLGRKRSWDQEVSQAAPKKRTRGSRAGEQTGSMSEDPMTRSPAEIRERTLV